MRIILLFTLLTSFNRPLQAQPDWTTIVPAAFAVLDKEVTDSLVAIRAQAATVREAIEEIVTRKGFDRRDIYGFDNAYFKEGMSKNFTGNPSGLTMKIDRDTAVYRMENLFVDLFFLDKNLFRWLDIEKRLQSHPDRRQFAKWALRYRELPPPLALEIHQPEPCKKWVANTVVCEIAVAVEAVSPDKAGDKVRNFDLKFVRPANAPQPSATEPVAWGFPLPPEVIWYSFPMNGQYSFRRDESLPGAGYVVLPDNAVQALYPIQYSNTAWRARWCSSRGKVTYTAMELRNGHQFFFNLPDNYFQGGELYRLEILAMPKGSSAPLVPGDICWQQIGRAHV